MLAQAGQLVEDSALADVWISSQRNQIVPPVGAQAQTEPNSVLGAARTTRKRMLTQPLQHLSVRSVMVKLDLNPVCLFATKAIKAPLML